MKRGALPYDPSPPDWQEVVHMDIKPLVSVSGCTCLLPRCPARPWWSVYNGVYLADSLTGAACETPCGVAHIYDLALLR